MLDACSGSIIAKDCGVTTTRRYFPMSTAFDNIFTGLSDGSIVPHIGADTPEHELVTDIYLPLK